MQPRSRRRGFTPVELPAVSGRKRAAFTLVELLVVVAIVAVLIALLMPALTKARRQALQVACISNIRQLGTAFVAYANGNRGWFPAPATGDGAPLPEDWIYWQKDRDILGSSIIPFLGQHLEVLRCPAGLVERPLRPYQEATGPYSYSYSVNIAVTGIGQSFSFAPPWRLGNPPCQLGKAVDASHKVLTVEEDSTLIDDGAWWPRTLNVDEFALDRCVLSIRHDSPVERAKWEEQHLGGGRTNVFFLDGHAEFIDRWIAETPQYSVPLLRL